MSDVPVVRQVLARLQDRLRLDAVDEAIVIRWDVLTGDGTLSFQLAADDGRWTFADGVPPASRLAVALGLDDLVGLADGRLSAGVAFLAGRLRLSGDLGLAQALLPGFDDAVSDHPPDQTAP
jgi:SCP-2 sterol transfer family